MLNGYRNISPLFALNEAIITSIRFINTMIKIGNTPVLRYMTSSTAHKVYKVMEI